MSLESVRKRAARRALRINVTQHKGYVTVTWVRPITAKLGVAMEHEAATEEEALDQLILMEDAHRARADHPWNCGCEDCMIDRIDLARKRM